MGKKVYVLCDSWFYEMYGNSDSDTYILGVFESKELAEEAREKMYNRTKELEPSFEAVEYSRSETDESEGHSYEINEFVGSSGFYANVAHSLIIYCYSLNQLVLMI